MATIHTFRDGSIGLLWRELRQFARDRGLDCDEDGRCLAVIPNAIVVALLDGNAPDWALDPQTCDHECDEDGVRFYQRAAT